MLGGPGTISAPVLEEIASLTGASTERIDGADRYEVAANVAQRFFEGADTALVASGILFPDGLSGTPLAHAYGAPILLSTGSCPPVYTTNALSSLAPAYKIYIGGPSSVTSSPTPCGTSAVRRGYNPPAASAPSGIPNGSPAEEAVYFVPHQDDELISMVGGIIRDINAGRRVHVYLMNAGYWTSVKDTLCAVQKRCLTNEGITASRNAEQITALERLGVPESNMHPLYIKEELWGAPQAARDAIAAVAAKLGTDARLRSMSWLDAHPSHYALGYALRDTCDIDGVTDCLFFQSPLYQKRPEALQYRPVVSPRGSVATAPAWQVTAAADAYREDYSYMGRHSIGWRSVPEQIRWVETNAYSWVHGRVWASSADELAAAKWIEAYQEPISTTSSARMAAASVPFEEVG